MKNNIQKLEEIFQDIYKLEPKDREKEIRELIYKFKQLVIGVKF